jgi:hypothetical protein
MLTCSSDPVPSISDLAADLTDSALELVAKAGIPGDSVAMELGLWHALSVELGRELCMAS